MTGVTVTDQQLKDALKAFDVSMLNGIICLAGGLRGRGLLDDVGVQTLHDWMTKPLSGDDLADNPAVQLVHSHIDEMFSALLRGPDL